MFPFDQVFGRFNAMQAPRQFAEYYSCFSMAVSGRDLEDGDKILLPQSALESLARYSYYLIFQRLHTSITG